MGENEADTLSKEKQILIVGAGVFGISTAYHLLKRGFKNVTVVDRAEELPAPDAASTDLNKIVRSAYEDPFYTNLAREAIAAWKDRSVWGDVYHESGFLVASPDSTAYGSLSLKNDLAAGARVERISTLEELQAAKIFPEGLELGDLLKPPMLHNFEGGWAEAAEGVKRCIELVRETGGNVIGGKKAVGVSRGEGEKVNGVRFEDGSVIDADIVVLATGSWTAPSFPDLKLDKHVFASGQGLALIQLTEEEAERYRDTPVVLGHDSGFYMFPPNKDNIVKVSAHGAGYTHIPIPSSSADKASASVSGVSTPRTLLSDGEDGLRIPKGMLKHFREILARIYPELARKDFIGTRMCWYTYTSDSDWIIDSFGEDENLFVASGGSGHGYKFLPILGRLIASRIEGTLSPDLVEKFSIKRDRGAFKNWGWFAQPRDLMKEELCEKEDLVAPKGTSLSEVGLGADECSRGIALLKV